MFPILLRRHTTGSIKWCLAVAPVVVSAIFLFIWLSRIERFPPWSGSASQSNAILMNTKLDDHSSAPANKQIQTEPVPGTPSPEKSDTELALVKARQAEAARAAIEAKPVAGHVSRRPEFVSEVEWEVLQDVAGHNSEMEKQLTHLVNKLLFYKKREAWMTPTTEAARRRVLAGELLAMLPVQVDEKAVDPAFAERLERDLRNYLVIESNDHQ